MDRTEIRESIRSIVPSRMLARPVDHRGYPVPCFVTLKDDEGRWEFRVVDQRRYFQALQRRVCWICGERLGRYLAFAVGPMCGITRSSGEPPQHLECSEFAVRACPFMLHSSAKRREVNKPEGCVFDEAGLRRNPGVALIWSTESYQVVQSKPSLVWRMGPPISVSFWKEGRPATRAEIMESVDGGLPAVTSIAESEGVAALEELARLKSAFERMLPAA